MIRITLTLGVLVLTLFLIGATHKPKCLEEVIVQVPEERISVDYFVKDADEFWHEVTVVRVRPAHSHTICVTEAPEPKKGEKR